MTGTEAVDGTPLPVEGPAPAAIPGTSCDGTRCDVWIDLTSAMELAPTRTSHWLERHPTANGPLWYGESDATTATCGTNDPDCDGWFQTNTDGSPRDNCPGIFNPSQNDSDDDGLGDECDSQSNPDPCRWNNGGCSAKAACKSVSNAAVCTCAAGYEGDGRTCTWSDRCKVNNGGCGRGTCSHPEGQPRKCSCPTGYDAKNDTCVFHNTCVDNNGGCGSGACTHNEGQARTCSCWTGYGWNGATCADTNECLSHNGGCGNAKCINNVGAPPTCKCPAGSVWDDGVCTRPCSGNRCDPLPRN
jgi:hypothetical protein